MTELLNRPLASVGSNGTHSKPAGATASGARSLGKMLGSPVVALGGGASVTGMVSICNGVFGGEDATVASVAGVVSVAGVIVSTVGGVSVFAVETSSAVSAFTGTIPRHWIAPR